MATPKVHIGTSGWNYDGWIGQLYPENIKSGDLLAEYAKTFNTVEINSSFYHLPNPDSVKRWREDSPQSFNFACKAHRYITHTKKLKDPEEGVNRSLEAIAPLKDKLGPILFQLPPRWKLNLERLHSFVEILPAHYRYAFEFRDRSWLCDEVYELLREHNIALCFYDYRGFKSPEIVTADFIYIRLHGPNAEAYTGSYDGRTLAAYARKIKGWQQSGMEVYCYFDNDKKGCAPSDATDLMEKLKKLS